MPGRVSLPPRKPWHRRYRLPLIVLGVGCLAAATVGSRLLRQERERLPAIAQESTTEGLEALAAGSFDVAKDRLARAADALARLGDPRQAEAAQVAREAAIFADLASASLEEIVEQVATRPGGWDELQKVHRGRAVLIDSRVSSVKANGTVELEYRVYAGSRNGLVDLTGLSVFQSQPPRPGDPVSFGARIDAVELGADNVWRIRMQPDSGVLLTTREAWAATESLGWSGPVVDPPPAAPPPEPAP
jgi:hypothetical protein